MIVVYVNESKSTFYQYLMMTNSHFRYNLKIHDYRVNLLSNPLYSFQKEEEQ